MIASSKKVTRTVKKQAPIPPRNNLTKSPFGSFSLSVKYTKVSIIIDGMIIKININISYQTYSIMKLSKTSFTVYIDFLFTYNLHKISPIFTLSPTILSRTIPTL